jgi:putative MATE family efflux protein
MENATLLTQGTPWKKMLLFAFPILLGMLFQELYTTVDTWMVGVFISQEALSAVGTVSVLAALCRSCAIGFSSGAGIVTGVRFGEKNYAALRTVAWNTFALLAGIGIAVSAGAFVFSRELLENLVAVPESLLPVADGYFKILTLGFVFQFFYNGVAALLRSIGDSRSFLYFLVFSSLINTFLDYVCIVGLGKGVEGAAWATVFSQFFCAVVSYWYMYRKYECFRFAVGAERVSRAEMVEILKQGIPLTVQSMLGTTYNLLMQRLVNSFGVAMTASYTVVSRVEGYLEMPVTTMTTTLATYTAQNRGARQPQRIRQGVAQGIAVSVMTTFLLSVLCFGFPEQIAAFFGITGQSAVYCVTHIRYYAFTILSFAAYFPLMGYYQGMGRSYLSGISSAAYLVLSLGIGYIGKLYWAELALFVSKPVTWFVIGLLNCLYFFAGRKTYNNILKRGVIHEIM